MSVWHGPVSADTGPDRGSVTVEAALGICSIAAMFGLLLLGVVAMLDQIRCQDAAVEAARLYSRGDRVRAEQAIRDIAPDGSQLVTTVTGDQVHVVISAPLRILLPGRTLRADATAVVEPDTLR